MVKAARTAIGANARSCSRFRAYRNQLGTFEENFAKDRRCPVVMEEATSPVAAAKIAQIAAQYQIAWTLRSNDVRIKVAWPMNAAITT